MTLAAKDTIQESQDGLRRRSEEDYLLALKVVQDTAEVYELGPNDIVYLRDLFAVQRELYSLEEDMRAVLGPLFVRPLSASSWNRSWSHPDPVVRLQETLRVAALTRSVPTENVLYFDPTVADTRLKNYEALRRSLHVTLTAYGEILAFYERRIVLESPPTNLRAVLIKWMRDLGANPIDWSVHSTTSPSGQVQTRLERCWEEIRNQKHQMDLGRDRLMSGFHPLINGLLRFLSRLIPDDLESEEPPFISAVRTVDGAHPHSDMDEIKKELTRIDNVAAGRRVMARWLARLVVAIIGCLAMLVPIVVLFFIQSSGWRIAALSMFVFVFGFLVSFSPVPVSESLACIAGFTAVLIVFVGTTTPGPS